MGKRGHHASIVDSLARDIEEQLTLAEVKRRLDDGKPHRLTMVNALFIDGFGLEHPEPIIAHRTVSTAQEFDEALYAYIDAQAQAYRNVVRDEMLATRALARAALVFCASMMRKATEGDEGGTVPPDMAAAFELIATVAGSLGAVDLEYSLSLPEPVRRRVQDYLDATPEPVPEAFPGMEAGRG